MKRIRHHGISLILFLLTVSTVFADPHMLIRIPIHGQGGMARLGATRISLDEGTRWNRDSLDTVVTRGELDRLRSAGFAPVILIADLESFYRSRLRAPAPSAPGQMGGYYTLSETVRLLQTWRSRYKNLMSPLLKIGTSIEGRPILAIKISANAAADEPEPEALYTSLHHAREPQSLMCVLYFMQRLLQGYGKDSQVTYLLNHRQLWFIPVVNPDGYVFNEQTNPEGGGLWRKNRRHNSDGSLGVDLNRNYSWKWGFDDSGSSALGFDETFRGTAPFSEPETDAVRKFVSSRHIAVALNFHSYGNDLLYPWGYKNATTPHHAIFRDMATFLARISGYITGTSFDRLRYTANGESDDWMYGETSTKNRIFAMTPEVGGFGDGFWPASERILPLARENYGANLSLAWMAGAYPILEDSSWTQLEGNGDPYLDPGERQALTLTIRNRGFQTAQKIVVNVRSKSPYMVAESGSVTFGNINPFKNRIRKNIVVRFLPNAPRNKGHRLDFLILSNGETVRRETLTIWLGEP